MLAYKICRLKNGIPTALFHATAAGTRAFPVGEWCEATDKIVRDGSGRKRWYKAGFHTLPTFASCVDYLRRFTKREDLCIAEVEIGGEIWRKPISRAPVLLSTRMKVRQVLVTVPGLDAERAAANG